jgi:hypothetical protein
MAQGEFSVTQFFHGGGCEIVRRSVDAEEAMKAFKHYTDNVSARMGLTQRVIITDGGDYTNMEWKLGEGITFGLEEQLKK